MTNISSNVTEFSPLGVSVAALSWTFLPLVIAIAVVDILVIGALFANAQLNRTVRFILVNILLAGIVTAAASIIFHSYDGAFEAGNFDDLQAFAGLCQGALYIFFFGGVGRFIFVTLFAATVFMLVRFWNKPTIEPENTKYFIIITVVIWIVAFIGATPLISTELVSLICVPEIQQLGIGFFIYFAIYVVLFLLLPAVLSFILLLVSGYYLNQFDSNSSSSKKTSKSMLKFGLFLLVGQGFNIAGQIIIPLLALTSATLTDGFPTVLLNACIFDISLIPTPILVSLFFTPMWRKAKTWLSRCCSCHQSAHSETSPDAQYINTLPSV